MTAGVSEVLLEGTGWTRVGGAEDRGHAAVWLRPGDDGATVLGIEVRPYEGSETKPIVEVSATFKPGAPGVRKLRRLSTFHRDQGRIPAEMDVEDELRAMQVLARTLDSLSGDARGRVLEWLRARQVAAEFRALRCGSAPVEPHSNAESVRLAQAIRR